MKEKFNRYNTTVRKKISEELANANERKANLIRERESIYNQLANRDILHADFLRLKDRIDMIHAELKEVNIEIKTWDAAREICLDVADDVF